jgi:hypothetical protein
VSTEDADAQLEFAISMGQWGFSFLGRNDISSAYRQEMMAIQLPAAAGRPLTVNLNATRYAGGPLSLGAAQPADNQTSARSVRNYVELQWGFAGANEQAVVDYPMRGCTFQLHASVLRMTLFANPVAANRSVPRFSGFVSPWPRVTSPDSVSPTFSTQVTNVASGATTLYPIPARATAYRWFTYLPIVDVASVVLTQMDQSGALPTSTDALLPGVLANGSEYQMGNTAGYFTIKCDSQFVQVANNAPVNSALVGLQFLLDLG